MFKLSSTLIRSLWLAVLLAFFGFASSVAASAFSPALTLFAYDGQDQPRIAYDGGSQPFSSYDSVAIPIANDKENRTPRAISLFAKFSEFLAAEGTGSLRLNIFGEGEAPGFVDTSTSANFANGRPLTSTFGNGSASDIFIRNAPVTGDGTLSEIVRLSQPGTRITLMQPASGFHGQALIEMNSTRQPIARMVPRKMDAGMASRLGTK